MAKKKIDKKIVTTEDNLATVIQDSINKKYKGRKIAYYLTETDSVERWLPTGCTPLNVAISNETKGGYPVGRIIEFAGMEGSGKSLLAAHAIRETQKLGGLGVYIDTENSYHIPFLKAIGVDVSKMLYIENNILEDIYEIIEDILLTSIADPNKRLITIIFDSQSGAIAKNEEDANFEKKGWNTDKAIVNSGAMRKLTGLIGRSNCTLIITQQLRHKLDAMGWGDPYCVDPFTTKIKIKYKGEWNKRKRSTFKEEIITFKEFSDRFANNDDFENPEIFDILPEFECKIRSKDLTKNKDVWARINKFIIKEPVSSYYTDGMLNASSVHRVLQDNEWIELKHLSKFNKVENKLCIVDCEVEGTHNYYANGYLNHNTTSGGNALKFHESLRLRIKKAGQIKGKLNGQEQVIGIDTLVQIVKNRCGPNMRKVNFKMYYDMGINDLESKLDFLKKHDLIKQGGAWFTWFDTELSNADGTPKEYKFQRKTLDDLIKENPHLDKQFDAAISDIMIMKYKSKELDEKNIIVDTTDTHLTVDELKEQKGNE